MKMPYWIWQYDERPRFCWNNDSVIAPLARVREKQGRLLGLMDGLGFDVKSASSLEVMTEDVLRSSEIEGLLLNAENVRSSVARHLGLDIGGLSHSDHYTEGVVQVMMDAVQQVDTAVERTQRAIRKSLFWLKNRSVTLNERQIKIINWLWD